MPLLDPLDAQTWLIAVVAITTAAFVGVPVMWWIETRNYYQEK